MQSMSRGTCAGTRGSQRPVLWGFAGLSDAEGVQGGERTPSSRPIASFYSLHPSISSLQVSMGQSIESVKQCMGWSGRWGGGGVTQDYVLGERFETNSFFV